MLRTLLTSLLAATFTLGWTHANAAEPADTIRKNLAERIPQLAQVDEVQATPMAGLYEVRIGTDVFYADAAGNYLIQGELIDVRAQRNLTEDRVNDLTMLPFKDLPLQDSIKLVRGNGKRQLAVFEDPNCGFCKRFERDMQNIDNITVHLFLYPILSRDSAEKSRNIWCAKDPVAAWENYMLRDQAPEAASCDVDALQRNLALGRKHKITGTPTIIFPDNNRVPGAIAHTEIEKHLAAAHAAK